jgi:hypothetical protein
MGMLWVCRECSTLFLKKKSLLTLILKQILVVLAYMIAPVVFKNDHPKIMGDLSSPPVSVTIKVYRNIQAAYSYTYVF